MITNDLELAFATGIGVPADFTVELDSENGQLKSYVDLSKLSCHCKIVSTDFKLKIYFTIPDGELIGFEYEASPNLMPEANLTKPLTSDGFIKLVKYPFQVNRLNYVLFDEVCASYDKNTKLVLIGDQKEEVVFYKVCKNLSVGIALDGSISSFLIEI